jgi:hypothetical protein
VGSVIAFTRALSKNTDLLVAGSMAASGIQSTSVATVLRRDVLKGDPQELSLVVHQLNFSHSCTTLVRYHDGVTQKANSAKSYGYGRWNRVPW